VFQIFFSEYCWILLAFQLIVYCQAFAPFGLYHTFNACRAVDSKLFELCNNQPVLDEDSRPHGDEVEDEADMPPKDPSSTAVPALRRIFNIDSVNEIFETPSSKAEKEDQIQEALDEGSFWNGTGLRQLGGWNGWVSALQQSVREMAHREDDSENAISSFLQDATDQVESLVAQASLSVKGSALDDFLTKASDLLETRRRPKVSGPNPELLELVENATILDDTATTTLEVANIVLRNGFVAATKGSKDDDDDDDQSTYWNLLPNANTSEAPLLSNFTSAYAVETPQKLVQAAEMGALCVSVYREMLPRTSALGHTVVDQGLAANVKWMVTDSIMNQTNSDNSGDTEAIRLRTVTIRGFDPSDGECDAEELVNDICSASPEEFATPSGETVLLHSGMLKIARAIYDIVRPFLVFEDDSDAPFDKVVLTGHSVGGSNALLILLLLEQEMGAEFIREHIMKVYTFGSPPIACLPVINPESQPQSQQDYCAILDAFGLPSDLIHSYVQPWDPINRLFTEIDALYPLAGDLGADGKTIFADGPPGRALRPIVRSLLESWNGWPRFRETFQVETSQNYTNMGLQHLLLPSPRRYLADRFVSVNIAVPPVDTVVRLSPAELHPVLEAVFPLDVFEISFMSQAIRSLMHHFSPSYAMTLVQHVNELENQLLGGSKREDDYSFTEEEIDGMQVVVASGETPSMPSSDEDGDDSELDWSSISEWLSREEE